MLGVTQVVKTDLFLCTIMFYFDHVTMIVVTDIACAEYFEYFKVRLTSLGLIVTDTELNFDTNAQMFWTIL